MIVGKREIKDGNQFDYLFPRASGTDIVVKKNAKLSDTVQTIKRVVCENSWQVKKLARFLKAETLTKTCRNIWEFAYDHFQYKIDKLGVEQIRTPARSWSDRKSGIDCDCFSTLIGATLYSLKIPFLFRLTKYKSYQFEHIYPVAVIGNKRVIMDAVIDRFNAEVPYKEKKDIIMELHTLNGMDARSILDEIEDEQTYSHANYPIDAVDLFNDELDGLQGRKERQARRARRKANRKSGSLKERLKNTIKKGRNILNKANPGAALLRAGVLASMKLNVLKVASKLRFAYWTTEEARRNNMDLKKFNQLQRIREKMDDIFFKAGGKPANLKKAILTGRGNRNRMVQLNGLGAIIEMPSDEDDLRTILGDLYTEDFETGLLNGLGEPASIATGAAVTAATGVLATISRIIKKLGGLFKRRSKQAQLDKLQANTDNLEDKGRKFSIRNVFSKLKEKAQERKLRKRQAAESGQEFQQDPATEFLPDNIDNVSFEQAESDEQNKSIAPRQNNTIGPGEGGETEPTDTGEETGENGENEDKENESFWSKNWKWIVPVGSVLIAGGIATAVYVNKKKKAKEALNGINGAGGPGAVKGKKTGTKKAPRKTTTSQPKRKKTRKKRKPRVIKPAVELIS